MEFEYRQIKINQIAYANLFTLLVYYLLVEFVIGDMSKYNGLDAMKFMVGFMCSLIPIYTILYYIFGIRNPKLSFRKNYLKFPYQGRVFTFLFFGHHIMPTYYERVKYKDIEDVSEGFIRTGDHKTRVYYINTAKRQYMIKSVHYDEHEKLYHELWRMS